MKRIIGILGIAAAMLFTANSANAAAVTLVGPGVSFDTFSHDHIVGSVSEDVFLYITNADFMHVSISASSPLVRTSYPNGTIVGGIQNLAFELFDDDSPFGLIGSATAILDATSADAILSNLLLDTTDPFDVNHRYRIHVTGTVTGSQAGYSLLVVGEVPIPAALLLFASGLGFLSFAGRRKARAKTHATA